jgi:hypothetical protein
MVGGLGCLSRSVLGCIYAVNHASDLFGCRSEEVNFGMRQGRNED